MFCARLLSPLWIQVWNALPFDTHLTTVGAAVCSREGLGALTLGGGDYDGDAINLVADATFMELAALLASSVQIVERRLRGRTS